MSVASGDSVNWQYITEDRIYSDVVRIHERSQKNHKLSGQNEKLVI
jgi:hypothetical protein